MKGAVQSSMLTKHILFVGFSLNDDNFHSIAKAVKKTIGGRRNKAFGTSIQLVKNPRNIIYLPYS